MARLRRSDPARPGIVRRRRGRGFGYTWQATGEPVDDEAVLERIAGLVIPPAWDDVWVCPWPTGHIQAVGTDTAGRRQYLYHEAWRRRRDAEKFARATQFGSALPDLRRTVTRDLRSEGLGERRVLGATVRLLDIGCFRIGSESYARDHETYGVATLLRDHVRIRGSEIVFDYPAKGSIPRTLTVTDPEVAEVLAPLRRRRGGTGRLLCYRSGSRWVELHSGDVNRYVKEATADHFSAKDFRTWSATVHAAVELASLDPVPTSAAARRRAASAAVRAVAEQLGNTPAVCRASYIDPRVIDLFDRGVTLASHGWPGRSPRDAAAARAAAERILVALLSEAAIAA